MMEKEKIMIETITIPMQDAVILAKAILAADDAEDVEEAVVDAVEEKMLNVSIVAKRVNVPLTAHSQEKITMNSQTWFPIGFQKPVSILIEGNADQKGQAIQEKH
jgi:O-phosphoseryl-tRNA(Cys) synthetase